MLSQAALSAFGVASDLWRSLACRHIHPVSSSVFMWLSPRSLCVSSLPVLSLISTPVIGFRVGVVGLMSSDDLILKSLIALAKALFPSKVTFTGDHGLEPGNIFFGGYYSTHYIRQIGLITFMKNKCLSLKLLHLELCLPLPALPSSVLGSFSESGLKGRQGICGSERTGVGRQGMVGTIVSFRMQVLAKESSSDPADLADYCWVGMHAQPSQSLLYF